MYGSPRNTDANKQLSHTEHRGLNWHLNTRNESIELHAVGLDLRKYEIYFYGRHDYRNHLGEYSEDPISTRFGYEENETVYDSLGGRGYMITNDFNRVSYLRFPEEVHDQTLRYLEEDFERIEEDPTANKIYQNGGQEVWMIEK